MKKQTNSLFKIESTLADAILLRNPEQKLALISINTCEAFLLIDVEYRIISLNESFKYCYSHFCEIPLAEDESFLRYTEFARAGFIKRFCQEAFNGQSATEEITITQPDKSLRSFKFYYKPAFDQHKSIIGAILTLHDVTNQQSSEVKILQNEKRYQALVENGGDAITVLTPEGKPLYISPSIKNILGYSEKEAMTLDLFSLVHPDDLAGVVKVWEEVLANPGVPIPGYTSRILHKDGSWRWLEDTVTNMLHEPSIGGIVDNFRDITERKNAELQLKESEAKNRMLIEQAFDGIIIYSFDGIILDFNTSAHTHLGYTKEEFTGFPVMNMFFTEDLERRPIELEKLKDGQPVKDYRRLRRKDGSSMDVEINTKLLPSGNVMGIARDITEWKAAEKRKEFDRNNLQALINNTKDLVWSVDRDLKLITCNKAFEEWIFRVMGELPEAGKSLITKKVETEVAAEWLRIYERALSGESFIETFQAQGSNELWWEASFFPIKNNEEIIGTACYARNITERISANRLLFRAYEENTAILESIQDGFMAIDSDGLVRYWNSDAEKMFGRRREDILGKNIWQVYPDITELKFYNESVRAFEEQVQIDFEQFFPSLGAWFLTSVYPSPEGLSIYFKDITEKKSAEKEQKKNAQAVIELNEQLNKRAEELISSNAELERFAYVASHDLQEPLRMVSSFLQLLQKKYQGRLDSTADQYISYAVDGAERMKRLILDLLEYSRVGTNKESLVEVNMNEIAAQITSTFSEKINETNAWVLFDELPVVTANKVQMTQLLQNLVSNSLKYNKSAQPEVKVGFEDRGDAWEFHVSDNGIGIEPKFFEKVFVIFQRLHNKNQFSGTGIGLAICKKIVERHGGSIWIESEPGKGCTFFFTIRK